MADLDRILSGEGEVAPEPEAIEEVVDEGAAQEATPDESETLENDLEQDSDEGDDKGQKTVPHAALHAEKQKVKRYTEQVADFEKKLDEQSRRFMDFQTAMLQQQQPANQEQQEAPDIFADPDAYMDSRLTPIQKENEAKFQRQRESFSRMMASEKYGAEKVEAAFNHLKSEIGTSPDAQAFYATLMQSEHPYGVLVDWHTKQQAMTEIGNDPEGYREKLKAEILAEMQAANEGDGKHPAPSSTMPTNLVGGKNVGARSGPAWGGPQTLNDIFNRGG